MGSRKNNTVTEGSCHFWSISTRSCLFGKGGIYLPVSEHIQTYCQTINYPSCPLLEGQPLPRSSREIKEKFQERRCYERVPGRFEFRLSGNINGEDQIFLLDDQSCTVDISQGGVRFESFREITVDSLVSFSLVAHSVDDPLEGVGMVRWCISIENAQLFHVGIAFVDTLVPYAVSSRLGLIVS